MAFLRIKPSTKKGYIDSAATSRNDAFVAATRQINGTSLGNPHTTTPFNIDPNFHEKETPLTGKRLNQMI